MCTLTGSIQFVVNNLLCISKQKGADKLIDPCAINYIFYIPFLAFDLIDGDLK